jgi:archaellum biogenesis protein FlaJ (TadC family)
MVYTKRVRNVVLQRRKGSIMKRLLVWPKPYKSIAIWSCVAVVALIAVSTTLLPGRITNIAIAINVVLIAIETLIVVFVKERETE